MKIKGYQGALIEIGLFVFIAQLTRLLFNIEYNIISYYWLCFTVLTGIWEFYYIDNHKKTNNMSSDLIKSGKHVWFEDYNLSMVIPKDLAKVFYSEYGAYADREYMTEKDYWSVLIEGTHCLFCGIYALLVILCMYTQKNSALYLCIGVSMGSQLMNSVLYMGEYFIQTRDKDSINYDSPAFPCGEFLSKRPFMWINIFWTVMPIYVISVAFI